MTRTSFSRIALSRVGNHEKKAGIMTAIYARAEWKPPGGAFLGGSWQQGNGELPVVDCEDGTLLASVHDSGVRDVRQALKTLASAFEGGPDAWPLWRRRQAMYAASELAMANASRLARIISAEGCKTIHEATREAGRAAETLRLTAELGDRLNGETLPTANSPRAAGRIGWFTREPVGVVAAITPFNDPLNLVVHKAAPALLAGNVVALKPADATPLSSLALAEIFLAAGVPANRLAVLPGTARAGRALVADPRVQLVSFTGGHRTGDRIARAAGAKKLLMELGGNCAVIVLADANLADAAEAIVDGAFGIAGQNCVSVQRVFAAEGVADALLAAIVDRSRALRVGSKTSAETEVGPMISEAAARRIADLVADARNAGGRVLAGGHRSGVFFEPTVLADVPPVARIMSEEVFGPVMVFEPFTDLSRAITAVNDSEFGLHAGVFTASVDAAFAVASRLRVGGVMINDTSDFRIDAMPFGGTRRSGIGREGVRFTLESMTEPKVVVVKAAAAAC
jgi:glyceraldehyde-3-phosphate dehydrogenase (NADP+)